jgi:hypothetical protein
VVIVKLVEVSGSGVVVQEENLNTGDLGATLAVRRLDLTDEQWARLEPLLPVPT